MKVLEIVEIVGAILATTVLSVLTAALTIAAIVIFWGLVFAIPVAAVLLMLQLFGII